jgi:hypothetical protein
MAQGFSFIYQIGNIVFMEISQTGTNCIIFHRDFHSILMIH